MTQYLEDQPQYTSQSLDDNLCANYNPRFRKYREKKSQKNYS